MVLLAKKMKGHLFPEEMPFHAHSRLSTYTYVFCQHRIPAVFELSLGANHQRDLEGRSSYELPSILAVASFAFRQLSRSLAATAPFREINFHSREEIARRERVLIVRRSTAFHKLDLLSDLGALTSCDPSAPSPGGVEWI